MSQAFAVEPSSAELFTTPLEPVIKVAKAGGATAGSLSTAFMKAMIANFGGVEAKEAAAAVGFLDLLAEQGGSVAAKKATRLYGGPAKVTEQAVRKAARLHQLLAIRDGNGNLHFPVWQFGPRGGSLLGLRDVLAILMELPQIDDVVAATFFLNPHAQLQNRSPLEVLREGDPAEIEHVKQIARAYVE